MGYTKLFSDIIHSSIWCEPAETRLLWVTMLAMADKYGEVMASIPGLAAAAKITIAQTEAGIASLMDPDPYSRTPDFEGRRIEKCDGGWRLLNHAKFHARLSDEDRRAKNAEYQRRFRERKASVRNSKETSASKILMSGKVREVSTPDQTRPDHTSPPTPPSGGEWGGRERETSPGMLPGIEPDAPAKPSKPDPEPETDPFVLRLYALFRRRPSTRMSCKERRAFKAANVDEEDLALVERFWNDPHPEWGTENYRRRDIQTLLNNWQGAVDRARTWEVGKSMNAGSEHGFAYDPAKPIWEQDLTGLRKT